MLRVLSERETRNAAMNAEEKGSKRESQLLWYCYYHNIPVTRTRDWNGKQVIAGVLINPPDDADYNDLHAPDNTDYSKWYTPDGRKLDRSKPENSRTQGAAC